MILSRLFLFHLIGTLQLCSSLSNFNQLEASHLTAHPLAGRPGARLLQVRARVLRPCSLVLRLHVHLASDIRKTQLKCLAGTSSPRVSSSSSRFLFSKLSFASEAVGGCGIPRIPFIEYAGCLQHTGEFRLRKKQVTIVLCENSHLRPGWVSMLDVSGPGLGLSYPPISLTFSAALFRTILRKKGR